MSYATDNHSSSSSASFQARATQPDYFSSTSSSSSASARTMFASSLLPFPSSAASLTSSRAVDISGHPANKHFQDLTSSILQNGILPYLQYTEILECRGTSKRYLYEPIEQFFSKLLEEHIGRVNKEFQKDARRELYSYDPQKKNCSATAKMVRNLQRLETAAMKCLSTFKYQVLNFPTSPLALQSEISQFVKTRAHWDENNGQEILKKRGGRSMEFFSLRAKTNRWIIRRSDALYLTQNNAHQENKKFPEVLLHRWPQLMEFLFAKTQEALGKLPEKDPRREASKILGRIFFPSQEAFPSRATAIAKIQSKAEQQIKIAASQQADSLKQLQDPIQKAKRAKQAAAMEKADRLYETYMVRSVFQMFLESHESADFYHSQLENLGLISFEEAVLSMEKWNEWLCTRMERHPSIQEFFKNFNAALDMHSEEPSNRGYITAVGQAFITSWGLPLALPPAFDPDEFFRPIINELFSLAGATGIWTLAPLLLERIQENKLEKLAPGLAHLLTLLSKTRNTNIDKFWDQSHGQELPLWRAILPSSLFKASLFPLILRILEIAANDRELLETLQKNLDQAEAPNSLFQLYNALESHISGANFRTSLFFRTAGSIIFGLFPTFGRRLEQMQVGKQFPHLMELSQLFTKIQGIDQLSNFGNKENIASWEKALPIELFQNRSFYQLLEIFEGFLADKEISTLVQMLPKMSFEDLILKRSLGSLKTFYYAATMYKGLKTRISSLSFKQNHASELLKLKKLFHINFSIEKTSAYLFPFIQLMSVYTSQAYKRSLIPFVREQALSLCLPYVPISRWANDPVGLTQLPRMSPNFWKNVQVIDLSNQWHLHHIPQEICHATNLHTLRLDGCENLETLPPGLAKLAHLQQVSIKGCTKLHFPEEFDSDDAPEALHALAERSSLLGSVQYNARKYRGPLFVAANALLGIIGGLAVRYLRTATFA